VDAAKLALEAARIAVDTAEVTLARRFIRAPFDGHVGITDIDVGDRVDANTMITTIDDRSTLLVNFSVPESFISQVTPGMSVSARLWESAQPAIQARVVAIDSRVNATSRAFVTQAGIDNSNDRLRPGMAFEMSLALSRGDYLAVPDVAVQWGADGAYLWVAASGDAAVPANKAERVEIQIIKRLGSALLIEADIAVGTLIIAEGVQSVRQGVALRLLDPSTLDGDARLELAQPSVSDSADATPNG
jgi:RND family efflux transporter MFP subunit